VGLVTFRAGTISTRTLGVVVNLLKSSAVVTLLLAAAPSLAAQVPPAVAAERAAFAQWLSRAAVSPFAAVAQVPVGAGLRLGPVDADLALPGIAPHRVSITRGAIMLAGDEGQRALPRGRAVRLAPYVLVAGGASERPVITVFDSSRARGAPQWVDEDRALEFDGPRLPPHTAHSRRVLAPDGVEVLAEDAGFVIIPINGKPVRLSVMRLPDPASGESDLEIYFRDATNGRGTYPAGRFVSLTPAGSGRWQLDFNRARNPFCSYSSAYACPAPWRGNSIPAEIRAGEQYHPDE
jgi:hypothetical protein